MRLLFQPKNIVIIWITFILVGLPLSPFLMSIGTIGLLAQWMLESILKRINPWSFLTYPGARIFTVLYLLVLISALWSSDASYTIHDLRVKLPLLIIPFTLTPYLVDIAKSTRTKLENIFIFSVLLSTLTSVLLFHHFLPFLNVLFQDKIKSQDVREFCVFTSHIRMGLFVALSICMLWARNISSWKEKVLSLMVSLFFIYFLIIIESFTGLIAVAVGGSLFLFRFSKIQLNKQQRWLIWPAFATIIGLAATYVIFQFVAYQQIVEDESLPLAEQTINGHPYDQSPENRQTENGYFVFRNICWQELQQEWNLRSSIEFNDLDLTGAQISQTLIRYLTSKGLTKDSVGIQQLDQRDIQFIEQGIPNYRYPEMNGLNRRLNRLFFEFQMMHLGYPPNGHSLFQRFIYWKNAFQIIKENWILGVGAGDVKSAFAAQYQKQNDGLNPIYQLRTHNQYLTLVISFGIIAWIFIPYLIYTLIKTSKRYSLIALIFVLILLLSFISEDTLETQAGVSFAAFFSAWWLGAPLWTSEKWRPKLGSS